MILSILVNSMPDEHTDSTMITYMNSPTQTQGNQVMQAIIDMLQVGQWYGKHAKVSGLRMSVYVTKVWMKIFNSNFMGKWNHPTHVIGLQSNSGRLTRKHSLQTLGDSESKDPELEESDDEDDTDEGQKEKTTRPSTPRNLEYPLRSIPTSTSIRMLWSTWSPRPGSRWQLKWAQ